MDVMTSTEFRKRFHRLEQETVVTVNGHRIGIWTPMHAGYTTLRDLRSRLAEEATTVSAQAQRDDLLRKINRGRN